MTTFEQLQRDPFLTESGAEQLLQFENKYLSNVEYQAYFSDLKNDSDERFKVSWRFADKRLTDLMLRYSIGDPIETMLEPAQLTFAEFERHYNMFPDEALKLKLWEANGYQYVMWLTGLAYLLGLHDYLPKIASWISPNPDDGNDPLIATLFARLGVSGVPTASELMHSKGYDDLYKVMVSNQTKEQKQTLMQSYIRGWYKNVMNKTVWKGWDKEGWIYFGFWSFEAAMATLLYDLDDTSYRDMTFYPKDLVDYARAHNRPIVAAPELAKLSRYTGEAVAVGEVCQVTGMYEAPYLNNRVVMLTQTQKVAGETHNELGQIIWYRLNDVAAKEWREKNNKR